jgi:hypothetical protein
MKGVAVLLAFVVGSTSPTTPNDPVGTDPEGSAQDENSKASESPPTEPEGRPAMAPSQDRGCVREDFEDFDAFVACRVENEAAPAPARPAQVPIESAPNPEQAELDEIRANHQSARERQVSEDVREEMLYRRVGIGLVVPGALASLTGLALVIVGTAGGGSASRKTCTVGKPCGETCIEVSDTCHIGGSQDGDDGGDMNPVLIGVGAAVAAVGVGMLIGSIFAFRRSRDAAYNARTRGLVRVGVEGGGLSVRF